MDLRVESRQTAPAALAGSDADAKTEVKPQVLLLSSGETTEFELVLKARGFGPYYSIKGDAAGNFELARKDGGS